MSETCPFKEACQHKQKEFCRNSKLPEAKTLKERYLEHRNGYLMIFGTAWNGFWAFLDWILGPIPNPFDIKIVDGYALVLLSPFLIVWWVVCGALVVCAFLLCLIPIVLIGIYSVIFELPASFVNEDWDKKDLSNYCRMREVKRND